jgi:hypothetical protein
MSSIQTWFKQIAPIRTIHRFSSAGSSFNAELDRDLKRINKALFSALLFSLGAAGWTGYTVHSLSAVLNWSIASIAAGAVIGFLFGIPRTARLGNGPAKSDKPAAPSNPTAAKAAESGASQSSRPQSEEGLRPNTNLEEVSDWLTKIIVGLGLVHLTDLQKIVGSISANAAAAMSVTPTATHVSTATAIIVGFAIEGFFGGYIYTRLFLQGAFARSDQNLMVRERETIEHVLAQTPTEAVSDNTKPSLPSPAQLQAATEVQRLVSDDPRAAVEKMIELAREYEQVRSSMASGPERTRRMSEIVGHMTVVALGAQSQLSQLSSSTQPGDRLAAVIILKFRFDPTYSKWLADRLVEDPPFVGFHAASALLAGFRLSGGSERESLKQLVADASETLKSKGLSDENRDRVIAEILA